MQLQQFFVKVIFVLNAQRSTAHFQLRLLKCFAMLGVITFYMRQGKHIGIQFLTVTAPHRTKIDLLIHLDTMP